MMKYLLSLFVLLFCINASADEAAVKGLLEKNYPQMGKVNNVYKAPFLGLYEVEMGGQLLYTDEQAQYLIEGNVYDLKTGRNLTEERSRKLFAIDFSKLPFGLALKKVKGNGKRKLVIFTDPNCGYCKKLEGALNTIDNVTLYRFMYPILPGSDIKVRNILCSKNPEKTWEDWMQQGAQPPEAKCATPQTEKVLALGQRLNIHGTPGLILADGTLIPGYLPAADLERALNGALAH